MLAYNILTTLTGGFFMNLLPIVLGFLALSGLNKKKSGGTKSSLNDIMGMLSNSDMMSLLPHIAKFADKNATEEEKNQAMMQLMTNPAVFELMQKFTSKSENKTNDEQTEEKAADKQENAPFEEKQNFSQESRDFFSPVEKVAGVEISSKLYGLYDNWYIKK